LIVVLLTQRDDIRKNYSPGRPTLQKNYSPFTFEGQVTFTYNLSEGTVAKVYMLMTLRVTCWLCDGYISAAVLNIQTEM